MLERGRWDPLRDGPLDEDRLRRKLESLGYRVERYVYPPGTDFPYHAHEVDKIDAVLEGRLEIAIDSHVVVLEAGEWVHVPRAVRHRARVIGNQPVVSLDAIRY